MSEGAAAFEAGSLVGGGRGVEERQGGCLLGGMLNALLEWLGTLSLASMSAVCMFLHAVFTSSPICSMSEN